MMRRRGKGCGRPAPEARGRARGRTVLAVALLLVLTGAGCGARIRYQSNRELLDLVARRAGLAVDDALYEVAHARVREDAVLVAWRGVERPGDEAWVWRFSRKSSEQRPEKLVEIEAILPLIREARRGFEASSPAREDLREGTLRYVTYTFESPVQDETGTPLEGRGIAGTLEVGGAEGDGLVYYFNLDNWGDRESLGREAIEPFLRAALEARP